MEISATPEFLEGTLEVVHFLREALSVAREVLSVAREDARLVRVGNYVGRALICDARWALRGPREGS